MVVGLRHSNTCRAFLTRVSSINEIKHMLGYILEADAVHFYYRTSTNSIYSTDLYTDMVGETASALGYAHGWMANSSFSGANYSESWAYCSSYGY